MKLVSDERSFFVELRKGYECQGRANACLLKSFASSELLPNAAQLDAGLKPCIDLRFNPADRPASRADWRRERTIEVFAPRIHL